ncbi:MAG TPA: 50S ribosomal protein L25 [Acidimicrobiia bacterium]|nr:50S ribosomal protein L25 [Acidimicrobiia bacterium]
MDQVSLRAETRDVVGTRPAKRLRNTGKVPAILYGRGLDPLTLTVDRRDLYAALHTDAGSNALINLEVEGTKKPYLTVAREIQRHPVRGEIAHLDFISISLEEKITADVGIEFLGTPISVKEEGALVETIRNSVTVEALPLEIPAHIQLDISEMALNDTLKVSDLPVIEGVEYLDDADASVVTVIIPRIIEPEEPEPEEGELLEGEEGELLEGEEAEAAEGEAAPEGQAQEPEEG